ncbi:UNVERIFIED_ORG: hypothetical protein B5F06_10565 [Lacrimispora saccharolytica]
MLNLIKCEFWKLKRRKFILLTILAAALFPIPMVIFAQKENLEFDWLFLNIGVYGYFLLLPTVLGILGAILFFTERSSGTQKNLNVIPVSTANLIGAKVITLVLFSILYLYDVYRSKNTIFPFFLISWFNTTQILWTFDFVL